MMMMTMVMVAPDVISALRLLICFCRERKSGRKYHFRTFCNHSIGRVKLPLLKMYGRKRLSSRDFVFVFFFFFFFFFFFHFSLVYLDISLHLCCILLHCIALHCANCIMLYFLKRTALY